MKYFWNSSLAFNMTALIYAVSEGHLEIVELLIRQEDIDINMKDIINQKHLLESNLFFFMKSSN